MPIYNIWNEKIFNKTKPLEFRSRIGKNFEKGSIVYIYESARYNGCKKVVGQFEIANIVKIQHEICDTVYFMNYYLKNILKDESIFKLWNTTKELRLKHYNDVLKLQYFLVPEILLKIDNNEVISYDENIENSIKLSKEISNACNEWLYDIGYYNNFGETNYNYYIEIANPILYNKKLELTDFLCNDKTITKAPQSWCYCQKKE